MAGRAGRAAVSRSSKLPPGGGSQRQIADAVNQIVAGRLDSYGSVTLTPSTTTTTVTNAAVGEDSVIVLMPKTANAAAALATTFVSVRINGSFTLTHANNAQTDREFGYGWIG